MRANRCPRAGVRAVALLLASLVCGGASGFGHATWDDPSCDPIPVRHDHNAHHFQSGRLTAADEHCFFCHSLRSLGMGLVVIHGAIAEGARVATVRVADVVLSSRILVSTAPSRAPPTGLL